MITIKGITAMPNGCTSCRFFLRGYCCITRREVAADYVFSYEDAGAVVTIPDDWRPEKCPLEEVEA